MDDDGGAGGGKLAANLTPNSPRGTRHQDHFSVKVHGYLPWAACGRRFAG
jgi:hypothetical protein